MTISLGLLGVVYPDGFVETSSYASSSRAIFGYGYSTTGVSISNMVNMYGILSTDTTGVGTARYNLAAAGYGGDKAIFGYGYNYGGGPGTYYSLTNLVSNTGQISTDVTGVGTPRGYLGAAGYGNDKAIFGFGTNSPSVNWFSMTNLVSNVGIVATDVTNASAAGKFAIAAATYGFDKAIFGHGGVNTGVNQATNLVSNTGVVAADVLWVGTSYTYRYGAGYGGDKAVFAFGTSSTNTKHLISNVGVVATATTTGVSGRQAGAASTYGGDKAIFGFGYTSAVTNGTTLFSNTGVFASVLTGVGTAREGLAAAGYAA